MNYKLLDAVLKEVPGRLKVVTYTNNNRGELVHYAALSHNPESSQEEGTLPPELSLQQVLAYNMYALAEEHNLLNRHRSWIPVGRGPTLEKAIAAMNDRVISSMVPWAYARACAVESWKNQVDAMYYLSRAFSHVSQCIGIERAVLLFHFPTLVVMKTCRVTPSEAFNDISVRCLSFDPTEEFEAIFHKPQPSTPN